MSSADAFAPSASNSDVQIPVIFVCGGAALLLGGLASSVTLTDDQLIVRNFGWRRSLPVDSITVVEPGYSGTVITTSCGRSITAMAVPKPNHARWSGTLTRSDHIANEIRIAAGLRPHQGRQQHRSRPGCHRRRQG
ncbi:hypothetical protein [Streptomyces sp. NPDC019507]|uniref:hypothetical protein n=1 Tax=Streptomyces sp. NPDC019507 TaxID=3154689 RepID=UPI0033F85C83